MKRRLTRGRPVAGLALTLARVAYGAAALAAQSLESTRAPVEILVIDAVAPPTEN